MSAICRDRRATMGLLKSIFRGRMMACAKTVLGGRVLASLER